MSGVDVVVIGGGIAGVSAAAGLSERYNVVLVELEKALAHHTTGRSAALFLENIGTPLIRGMTLASRSYLAPPPEGLAEAPLLESRALLCIGDDTQQNEVRAMASDGARLVPSVRLIDTTEALELCPALVEHRVASAVYEPDSMSVDVMALHQSFVRAMRANGGVIERDTGVTGLRWTEGAWDITTTQGTLRAPVVVNAAGAWADEVATMAGVRPVGIMPLRRTAFTSRPSQFDGGWPLVTSIDRDFYCKPEAGGYLLCSPMDETPCEPCDASAEELDVAMAIDAVNSALDVSIRSVHTAWAGLRSFVEDRSLVLGFDDELPGFFWCVGQGGYGIQTSPAAGATVAALVHGEDLPEQVQAHGVTPDQLSPARLKNRTMAYGLVPPNDY
ncbi:MAG: NAD(P)/FAD-dependent oxidoreductase [Acidimicrobiales bacterium]